MIETNNRVRSRIEASMAELRGRIGEGGTEAEHTHHTQEAVEAVTEQGIDLLDRIGWFDQVNLITDQEDAEEQFKSVAELYFQNGEALLHDATQAGLEEEFEVNLALLRFLAELTLR